MVQKSASRQFAFWPDHCIASSRRSLPITVRLIAFQKRDWKYIHTYIHTGKWKRRKRKAEKESGNGKLERKPGTETGNGRQHLYTMVVDLIELDLSPSLINVNKLIVLGKLITIIQGL